MKCTKLFPAFRLGLSFTLCAFPAMVSSQTMPSLTDFTPRFQREAFKDNDMVIMQFSDNFCPECEDQIEDFVEGLAELPNTDFLERTGGLFVDMDLWSGDPFVEEADVSRYPTLIVYDGPAEVARFEGKIRSSQVVRALEEFAQDEDDVLETATDGRIVIDKGQDSEMVIIENPDGSMEIIEE